MATTNLNFELPLMNHTNMQPISYKEILVPPTQKSPEEREAERTEYIEKCRNYVFNFIMRQAPKKMHQRFVVQKENNAVVFRYSPPVANGQETAYFSHIIYDTESNQFSMAHTRPQNHPTTHWYFPIYYIMNGFTKNSSRTFQALGLKPVEVELREQPQFANYEVKFFYSRQYGNSVSIQQPTQTTTPPTTTTTQES